MIITKKIPVRTSMNRTTVCLGAILTVAIMALPALSLPRSPVTVSLRTAGNYAIMAKTGVSVTGTSNGTTAFKKIQVVRH